MTIPKKSTRPSGLPQLLQTIERLLDDPKSRNSEEPHNLAIQWLEWTHEHLSNSALYHKKQQIKKATLVKMATQLLSKDELERIDNEAESELAALDAAALNKAGDETDDDESL